MASKRTISGIFLGFDGRELDEAGEAGDAADAYRNDAALGGMALDEAGQGALNEGIAVVAGVGQDIFVLNDLEVVDPDDPVSLRLGGWL